MAKLSAWSLWSASVLVLLSASALGDAPPPKPLEQKELSDPALVSAWLKANGATADRAQAERFFNSGLKAKKMSSWGPAVKGFGASAVFYPAPKALIEYANASLRSASAIRVREKTVVQKSKVDMAYIESIYRSALASDAILNTLSVSEKEEARQNADCLAAFVQTEKMQADCAPLQTYGLKK